MADEGRDRRRQIQRPKRWCVMISGRGSNLAALLDIRDQMDLRLVVSSEARAPGLLRARRAGVPVVITPYKKQAPLKKQGANRIDWSALDTILRQVGITHIFLAGFMKVLPESFVAKWKDQILNLHPSLLPAYPGLRSIERAHSDGADMGVTIHVVTPEVDAGQVILRRRTLKAEEVREYSLGEAEFLVHLDEQRASQEAVRRWKSGPMW